MHHFTLRKMKSKQPHELSSIIEKFIINSEKPTTVRPKQRAPRGSRKKKDQVTLTRTQLDRMLTIARQAGDKEMVAILAPKKSFASCKRELMSSIRQGKAEQSLWEAYVEATANLNAAQQLFAQNAAGLLASSDSLIGAK